VRLSGEIDTAGWIGCERGNVRRRHGWVVAAGVVGTIRVAFRSQVGDVPPRKEIPPRSITFADLSCPWEGRTVSVGHKGSPELAPASRSCKPRGKPPWGANVASRPYSSPKRPSASASSLMRRSISDILCPTSSSRRSIITIIVSNTSSQCRANIKRCSALGL
jgi:hypothetical protein